MGFKFRLEKVLKFRKRVVEQHTREVAEANRVVSSISEKLKFIENDIDEILNKNLTEMNTALCVESLISRNKWMQHLETLAEEVESERQIALEELSDRRAQLTGAWQDLEVLKMLRQKQKQQWIEEQRKLENKELDEIGQIRADRQHREKVSPV